MPQFLKIQDFLNFVKNFSKSEIIVEIDKELALTSSQIKENKHNYEERYFKGLMKYYRYLKSFKYLLQNEEKDLLLRDKDYKVFEWVVEKLVLKNEIGENVRTVFN